MIATVIMQTSNFGNKKIMKVTLIKMVISSTDIPFVDNAMHHSATDSSKITVSAAFSGV